MNKGTLGFAAGLFLLGAGIRLGSQSGPNNQPGDPKNPLPITPIPARNSAPGDGDGPWQAACEFFRHAPEERTPPTAGDPVDPDWKCVPPEAKIRFLIAAVPDPKRTHLALYFDRSIESLVSAAEAAGYILEDFWIPWSSQADRDLLLLQDRKRRERDLEQLYERPGLLAFRRGPETGPVNEKIPPDPPALFIFLAGETPTNGVSENALEYAVNTMRYLDSTAPILLAGPTYSGSLEALCEDLKRLAPTTRVASGTVTQEGAKQMVESHLGPGSYQPLVHNDKRALDLFFGYVNTQWRKPSRAALISESGTAYGQQRKSPPNEDLLYLSYPREIARLRNAYQEETGALAGEKPQGVIEEGVKLTLKDGIEEPARDSIDAFSPLQSPASEQAVLAGISNTLRREHVELSGVAATDILDSTFLDRYLRLSAPDVRLFMLDADVLLSREVEAEPLTGLLSVTTYPLFSRGQHWMNKAAASDGNESRVQFSSLYEEGVYNSVRFLLYTGRNQETDAVLRDYARPFSGYEQSPRPPLWLTVLGRDGYWPVALLDSECQNGIPDINGKCSDNSDNKDSLPAASPEAMTVENTLHPESPSFGWYFCFWALVIWGALHCLHWESTRFIRGTVASNSQASRMARKVHDWLYENVFPDLPKRWPEHHDREDSSRPFLLSATLAIFGALSVFSVAGLRFASKSEPWTYFYAAISLVVLVALIRIACLFTPTNRHYYPIVVQAWVLVTGFVAFWTWWCLRDSYESGRFFAYRSLWLTSGVSPAVPMLVLIAAIYCWAWIHLKRQVQVNERREYEASVNFEWHVECTWYDDERLGFRAELDRALELRRRFTTKIIDALNDVGSVQLMLRASVFLLLWLGLFQPWRHAVSFEHRSYDWVYTFLLSEVFWVLALSWLQFCQSWREFKKFLEWLENQPVRRAFSRLQGRIAWVPLIAKMPEHLFFISVRCCDCLLALTSFPLSDLSPSRQTNLRELKERLLPLSHQIAGRMDAVQKDSNDSHSYNRLQALFETARLWITNDLRQHCWTRGSSESLSPPPDLNAHAPETAPKGDDALLVIEEEFIALRSLMFMRFVYRQLRNILGFVATAFVLFVISLNAYPFQAHRWIGFSSVVIFLALATAVAMAFAQMDKDAILSRITRTNANELNKTFFLRTAQFTALPLLTLLASQFPSINHYVFFWAQPALEALH